jgi:hypothetical protein
MNNEEATALLDQELAAFRDEHHEALVRRVLAGSLNFERTAASGAKYQVEIQFLWDDQPGGPIRVVGSIDDGGLRAFVPLTLDFIKSSGNSEQDAPIVVFTGEYTEAVFLVSLLASAAIDASIDMTRAEAAEPPAQVFVTARDARDAQELVDDFCKNGKRTDPLGGWRAV